MVTCYEAEGHIEQLIVKYMSWQVNNLKIQLSTDVELINNHELNSSENLLAVQIECSVDAHSSSLLYMKSDQTNWYDLLISA